MDWRVGAHRGGDRVQVVRERFDAVCRHPTRIIGDAESAGVVRDDPEVVGKTLRDLGPHVMRIRPAVHEQHRRTVGCIGTVWVRWVACACDGRRVAGRIVELESREPYAVDVDESFDPLLHT